MTAPVWTTEQVADTFADAYYGAAKSGADMRRVAEALEALRDPLCHAERPFYVWELLDDRVAEAYGNAELPAVTQVRAAYVQTLGSRAVQDADNDWTTLVKWYAEAAVAWRFDFCERLMKETSPAAGKESEHAILARGARFAQEERWYESDPMFALLAAQPFLLSAHVARFIASRGLIEHYCSYRYERARARLDEALKIASEDPYVLAAEADFLLNRGDVAEARVRCQRAIEIDPRLVMSYNFLGDCSLEENDLSAAEAWYRHAIKQRPGELTAYGRLCRVYGKRADEAKIEDPIPEWERRVEAVEPRVVYTFDIWAANAYQERRELQRAEEWFRRAITRVPSRIGGTIGLGYLWLEQARPEEARAELERVVQMAPDALEGYLGMARLEEQAESWSAAERWHRLALRQRPEAEGIIGANIAWTQMKQGRFAEAEEQALAALRADPHNEGVLAQVERVANDASVDESGARRMFDRILAALGESYAPRYHHQIGLLLSRIGRHDEAAEEFLAAVRADPANSLFYTTLARELREIRGWDAGRRLLASPPPAVQADASFRSEMALLRNDEANEYFSRSEYARAVALYEEAVRYTPADAVLHSNLASARESDTTVKDPVQRFDGMRAALAEAVRLDEQNPEYAARLAGAERLADLMPFYADCGVDRLPTVLPITLEVAGNLVKYVATEDFTVGTEIAARIAAMRQRLSDRYGVRLPGVRFRDNMDFEDGMYAISLKEVPVAGGVVKPEQRFCTDAAEEIERRGVPHERAHPSTGAAGSWIGAAHWEAAAGLSIWPPMECAVRHLESIMESNLGEMLNLDDVYTSMVQNCAQRIPDVEKDSGGVPLFAGVLRALLAERVSIAAIDVLCERYLDARARGVGETDLVEELRTGDVQ